MDQPDKDPLYSTSMITREIVDRLINHTWSGGFDRNGSHSSGEYQEYECSVQNPGSPYSTIYEILGLGLKLIAENENRDWETAAMQFHDGMMYYRNLLVRIGEIIGPDARMGDDGVMQDDIIVAKLPELVLALTEEFDNRWSLKAPQILEIVQGHPTVRFGEVDPLASHGKDKLGQAVDLLRDLLLHDDGTAEARATRFVLNYQKERS